MNKKIAAVLLIIAALLIVGIPQYESYQNNLLSEHFNESMKNASSTQEKITQTITDFNSKNNTDADTLMSTINNQITPQYSEEALKLNESAMSTDNDTEKKYIDLQIKRVSLESQSLNLTVNSLNAIAQYVRGEKSGQDAQDTMNKVQRDMAKNSEDLNNVYSDIQKLLKENPDLDKKLHDLNLQPQFYGEVSNQQIANNTAANTTANSTQ
ncbi:MAG: hypothetical protein SOZ23_04515 [Methanosphaera sp.]|uniref:hypothetical protein n=1 Tax=Methanosphaera sp. TaxID=2666342 RepID=UPI0025F25B08|nr:hypothetical protein [Methanosphaera sp.]MCI5867684.1 hypothetical protein [Methanosphaera sp.]MDY3956039.1 hypothetical protein [Methanosphaera sp.]